MKARLRIIMVGLVLAACGGTGGEGGWQDVSTGADGGNGFPQDGASGAGDGAAQNPDGGAAGADAAATDDSSGSQMDGSMQGDALMEMDGGEMMDMGGGGMDGGGQGTDGGGEMDSDGGTDDAGSAGEVVGSACSASGECPPGGSGTPVCKTDWPDGYCLVEACADHGHDCPLDAQPGGGKCVLLDGPKCLAVCASDGDCRTGYACVSQPDAAGHGSATVCVPQ